MTLEEAIKHAEEVAATSCDGCREEHWQLAAWLKELQDIKENSIVIPKRSTAWEAAQLIINAESKIKPICSTTTIAVNTFNRKEILALGKHLLAYAEIENELKM